MKTLAIDARTPRFRPSMLREASPALWRSGMALLTLFALCALLSLLDPRLFNGISTWIKPAKFALSLAVQMLTLAAALLLLPQSVRNALTTRAAVATVIVMAFLEQAYIVVRAARLEASHYNATGELARILYAAMGIGAVSIMLATAVIGWQIRRHGGPSLLARTTGLSFIAAAVLTIWIGLTLGGMGSHWIGGDQTDASGLPLLGWSTTGGDLRVPHFIGLHIMQVAPLAAFTARKSLVTTAFITIVAAAILTYMQALAGHPLVNL